MIDPALVRVATCCRAWQVVLGYPIRRCGHCGTRPSVINLPLTWAGTSTQENK